MKFVCVLVGAILGAVGAGAWAQGWLPQKNVEIIASSVPGGSNDKTARTLERAFISNKLSPSTFTVVNKSGGGGTIAFAYLSQHAKDPHFLGIAGDGLLTNHILGASKLTYTDFSPIALLFNDYVVMAVATNSPLKTGSDFVERLKKDPNGMSIGFANAFGSTRHISLALLVKAIGGNPRDLKTVVFKGSAEAIAALLGGHIDAVVVGATNTTTHLSSGRMRVIAVGAPKRLTGVLADVPTWREQGVDLVSGSWRGIFGARGLTDAQVAFWEQALRKASQAPEYKSDLEMHYWIDDFKPSAEFKKELEKDYAATKSVLVAVGLAKQ
jgi:putative tricarboxylic transport membrane protein